MGSISKIVRFVGFCGGFQLARVLTQGQPRILMYHRFSEGEKPGYVSKERIRQQLLYISKHYRAVTLSQLVSELFEGRALLPNTIVITVDDGYRDFYDVAWPIARELNVPVTLFVTTGFVNGDLWLWPDQVAWMLAHCPSRAPSVWVGGLELNTSTIRDQYELVWQFLMQYMLSVSDPLKHWLIADLSDKWRVELPLKSPPAFSACTWDQLLEMQSDGLEVGGHTVTHPSLGRVEEDQAKNEIFGCMDMLTEYLGPSTRSFCYPNGMPNDYSGSIADIVRKAGFSCAVTAFADMLGVSQRYALRRHAGSADLFQFYKAISGIEFLGHQYRRTVQGAA